MKASRSGTDILTDVPSERRRLKDWVKGSRVGEEKAVDTVDAILDVR